MKKNSIKNTRINSEVQKELSTLLLREIKDPRISMMTSIVGVEVAPDLKTAKVYVSVLGTKEQVEETYKGLKSAAPFLRGQLAKTVNLRNTPELIFIMDQSIEYGVNMSKLIEDVTEDIHRKESEVAEDDFEDEDNDEDDDDVFEGGFEDDDDYIDSAELNEEE